MGGKSLENKDMGKERKKNYNRLPMEAGVKEGRKEIK
jgi:hypothetical protein